MECACVRNTDLPGASRLFADFLYHPDRVRAFYPRLSHRPEAFHEAARAVRVSAEHRAALVTALRKQNGDSPALELLAKDGTVAVVTGQQVGLYSGPAYTIYKALTAVRLARRLTDEGVAAVPVFWLATEDHDFAEVNHVWMFGADGRPVRLEMSVSAGNQPVGDVRLQTPPDLGRLFSDFPFGEEVADLVRAAYQPGLTMGEAFDTLLRSLTRGYDLLHIDPMRAEIRALAAPLVRAAIQAAPELTRELLERNRELGQSGYHAQVHIEPHTSLVFLLESGRRLTLRRNGTDYLANGRVISQSELMDRAESLSPNALLRPVAQDYILPTVAYVGGPAELAYLAQSQVIYRQILSRMPVPVHRAGFTLLDARGAKLMGRYGLSLPDVLHAESDLRERIGARLTPPTLERALARAGESVSGALDGLNTELAAFDPTLAAALGTSRRKIEYQMLKMSRKISREMIERSERAAGHAAYLHNLLFPEKHLQERLYSIVPFIARHGLDLVNHVYENVHLDCPDHQLLAV
jgi:bacillithiol biosynthesis cysteine-adding enzyme BshC